MKIQVKHDIIGSIKKPIPVWFTGNGFKRINLNKKLHWQTGKIVPVVKGTWSQEKMEAYYGNY